MSDAQAPILVRDYRTGKVYIVTSYRRVTTSPGKTSVQMRVKHEVTEQFNFLSEQQHTVAGCVRP